MTSHDLTAPALPETDQRIHLSPRDIPPLPGATVELLGIANDPTVCFSTLAQVVRRDQALTLRMLSVANSPYYGCSRRIDSIRGAVAVLGTRQVQNIASAMALSPAFESPHGPQLWKHGLTTAVWTTQVTRALSIPPLDYVFTAGLLHDIGVVVLLSHAPQVESACLTEAHSSGRPLVELEQDRLGTDHASLGARACSSWKLPERLADLVGKHHDVEQSSALDHRVLHAANALARLCEDRDPGPASLGWEAALATLERLDLDEDEMLALLGARGDVLAEVDGFA
ncbi:MAG: HDOD domain-containing protein [Nannocystaceae bacterium]|nr:HDOD domain-containing protein [bacterium]